ncbi:MAG: DEAD/DEAH box helicase, partial [Microbacterium sp.]
TGRAGNEGTAVTFVDWDDLHKWALINRALEFGQPEPVETYSSSPHLYTDLDIPEGTKGRISSAPKSDKPRRRSGENRGRSHGGSDRPAGQDGQSSRRRRRPGSSGAGEQGEHHVEGAGTHDGSGAEHRDGKSGGSARRRRRRRSGSKEPNQGA